MLSTKGSPTKFYKVYDLEEDDLLKEGKKENYLKLQNNNTPLILQNFVYVKEEKEELITSLY